MTVLVVAGARMKSGGYSAMVGDDNAAVVNPIQRMDILPLLA